MPSNQTFIVAAYALTWVVLLGYAVHLGRSGRQARAELERMTTGADRGRDA